MRRTQSTPLGPGGSDATAHGWAAGLGHGGGGWGGGGQGARVPGWESAAVPEPPIQRCGGISTQYTGVGFLPGHSKNQPGYLRGASCVAKLPAVGEAPRVRPIDKTDAFGLRCKTDVPNVRLYKLISGKNGIWDPSLTHLP